MIFLNKLSGDSILEFKKKFESILTCKKFKSNFSAKH